MKRKAPAEATAGKTGAARRPLRLFFVCTGNAARSQMAEGLAQHIGGGRVEAHSAGTMPSGVSSYAIEALAERGIDISRHDSKGIDDVPGPFDRVVTLCDDAAGRCAAWIRDHPSEHWSTPDPSFVPGGPEAVLEAFREVRDGLETKIRALIGRLESERGAE